MLQTLGRRSHNNQFTELDLKQCSSGQNAAYSQNLELIILTEGTVFIIYYASPLIRVFKSMFGPLSDKHIQSSLKACTRLGLGQQYISSVLLHTLVDVIEIFLSNQVLLPEKIRFPMTFLNWAFEKLTKVLKSFPGKYSTLPI